MIRLLLSLVLFAGSFPVAASAAVSAKNPDTYTYLTISEADSLDPAWAYDTASHNIQLNVYEYLFHYDKSSTDKLVPLLAEKVPTAANGLLSPDGKTYTIPLRKGVKFHDGSVMTPEDVRYSLLRFMLYDRAAGPSSLLLEPLVGRPSTRDAKGAIIPETWADATKAVSIQGDKLILRLPRPYAPLLSILASFSPVVSKKWAAANGDWDGTEATWIKHNNPQKQTSPFYEKVMGSGAFKLAALAGACQARTSGAGRALRLAAAPGLLLPLRLPVHAAGTLASLL